MLWFVHISLVLYYIDLLASPPSQYSSTIPVVRDAIYLGIVILSFGQIALARKALVLLSLDGIRGVFYFWAKYGLLIGSLGIVYWLAIIYFALSKKYDNKYSKWGQWGKNSLPSTKE